MFYKYILRVEQQELPLGKTSKFTDILRQRRVNSFDVVVRFPRSDCRNQIKTDVITQNYSVLSNLYEIFDWSIHTFMKDE